LIVALCCAALGISLSVRFKAIFLIPASLLVIAFAVGFGIRNGQGPLTIVLTAPGNLLALQLGYFFGGLGVQRLRSKWLDRTRRQMHHNHFRY
jgi:membrane protein DedA with SNARE-associated domain